MGLVGCEWHWLGGTRFAGRLCMKRPGIKRGPDEEKSFWSVEEVNGCVGDSKFFVSVRRVAAGCRSFAAFGLDALDGRYAREHPVAFMAHHRHHQPRDGIDVGGWVAG